MTSKDDQVIEAGKVVTLAYVLRDEDGEQIDSSEDDGPMAYLHGAENMVPGLEKALEGKRVGDHLRVVVPPEDAYGERDEEGVQVFPRSAFPEELEVGMQLVMEDEDGDPIPLWVAEVEGDEVTVDFNHPLAGATLDFDVEVLSVRVATEAEREHGHPHEDDDEEDEET